MKHYKIALVLDDSLDKPDGVQQYMLTVGQWLTSQGHEVHYLVGETSRTDIPHVHSLSKNVKVRFNHNRMSMPLPASKSAIRKLLSQENFDIIHVQMPYSPFLAGRIVKIARAKTAVVATFHIAPHSFTVHAANVLLRQITGGSLKRLDDIISVSRVAQDFARQTFGVDSQVIPNTLPLGPFEDAKPFTKYAKTTNIVFLGRLVERKGCQYLLKAVNRLHREHALPANCQVVICGKGPLEASLKDYVRGHELDEIVRFEGFIEEADKPRYLASADIAVYPSTGGESFGIVLLEGMAAARGVVLGGSNPGYVSVIGEHPEALFDPADETEFAGKLKHYLQDAQARKDAHDWQSRFVKAFDVSTVGKAIVGVYEDALHKRQG